MHLIKVLTILTRDRILQRTEEQVFGEVEPQMVGQAVSTFAQHDVNSVDAEKFENIEKTAWRKEPVIQERIYHWAD